MTPRRRICALSGALLLLAPQPPAPAQGKGAPTSRPKPKALAEWPRLKNSVEDRIVALTKTLRTTKKRERVEKAEAELATLGAAAAPALLSRLSDYRVNINEPLMRVLDKLTEKKHAALLARSARDRKTAVRVYVLKRLSGFHLPAMAPVFRHARKDRDETVAFQAALGLTSTGDLAAMEEIFARCTTDWHKVGKNVATALTGARGQAATAWVQDRMAKGGDTSAVTGLRLLRSVALEDAARLVRPYLDSHSHNVKKAAINALRVIVDGQPPLEKLSVFQGIELAKEWKKRV